MLRYFTLHYCVFFLAVENQTTGSFDYVGKVVIPFVTAALSGLLAWLISKRSAHQQALNEIHNEIKQLISYGIEYPYLEGSEYCLGWDKLDSQKEEDLRYQNYCCFVFNLIARIFSYYGGNSKKTLEILHVDELIRTHRSWWQKDRENRVYGKNFQRFVESRIQENLKLRQLEGLENE